MMGLDDKLSDEKITLQGSCCGKEEIVEELRNCLPKWVTQEQVTDMIRGTWRNVVEIVDDFYEHETVYYEQVPAVVSSFTCGDGFSNHEALVSKLELLHCETEGDESCKSSQFHKLRSVISSQKNSISPAGPKQASITKFFNKVPSDDTKA